MAIPNKPTGRNVNWGEKGIFFLSLEQLGKGREKENSIFSTPENSKLGKEERGENLGTGKTGISNSSGSLGNIFISGFHQTNTSLALSPERLIPVPFSGMTIPFWGMTIFQLGVEAPGVLFPFHPSLPRIPTPLIPQASFAYQRSWFA